jgi:putative oxidoreductase
MNILLDLIRTDGDWAVTTARIVLGLVFFAHGAQKLLGWYGGAGLKNTVEALTTQVHLPKALAVLVICTEFFGGLGLLLGFFSRLAALGTLTAMLGAVATVHYRFGLFMNWFGEKKGHGFEYHLLAIALALVVIVKGGGAFSLDHAICEHQAQTHAAAEISIH